MARPADAGSAAASALRGALLLAGLVAAGLAARSVGAGLVSGAPTTLQGAATLVAAGALLTGLGMPRQMAAFAGGYAFGPWLGGAVSLLAQVLGCAIAFWWARIVARDWARRRLGARLARMDRWLARRPFTATLTLRLLPVGNNLALNLMGGVSGLPAGAFLAASLIGYVPQTAVFALAGSGVHVDRSVQIALGAGLFAASAVLGWLLSRARHRVGRFDGMIDSQPQTGRPHRS